MRIQDNIDRHGNKIYVELPDAVPNELLNNEWALTIHSQTLERLNERGGLTIIELIMNLKRMTLKSFFEKYGYNFKVTKKDVDELVELLKNKNVENP